MDRLYEIAESIKAEDKNLLDMLELAWGVIANAGGGDWETQTDDWQEAAVRWRDRYHSFIEEN